MYDRQTESWWQQYGGDAIVGRLAGKRLEVLPSRLESLAAFVKRAPDGKLLVPDDPTRATMAPIPMSATTARPRLSCSGAGCRRAWPR